MAIDTKNIQYFVWKIVKFSMNSCCRFVQKHPFFSCAVSLLFLLYLFLPSVFLFLIYSSPVIVCISVFLRYYFKPKQHEIKKDKRVDEKSSVGSKSLPADAAVVVSRNDIKTVMHDHQMSRRKNVIKELEAEATTPADASIIGIQNVITGEKGSASLDHGESSSWNVSGDDNVPPLDQRVSVLESEPSMDDLIVQKDLVEHSERGNVAAAGGEEEEESSDEEETQQDGNNAVEWTADDQQNLMDLGDSELERNKRLESLIARRRARKLFKMAVEKRMMESGSGGQMPPLSVVRNNILNNISNNQDFVEGLQVPGSAPSVLLPARNPFDIPYDPYEERPNLTGDSFHEEFSIHQRELLFCRHESFFLGPSFSVESQQDQHDSHIGPSGLEKMTAPGLRLSRYRTVSDMSAHEQLIDELLASQDGEALSRNISATDLVELGSQSQTKNSDEESKLGMAGMKGEAVENSADRSEFQMETDSSRDNSSEPCSLASNEASERSFHTNTSSSIGNLESRVDKPRQNLGDRIKSSLTFTIPEEIALNGPSYDSSPSAFDRPRMDDRLFFRDKGPCHSPGYSIASDLQVEVSELGSPPLPMDGTMSPADAESSYDGDVEKDITSGSEEMWGASCHLAGVDESESRSREVNEISVDDILGAGLSAMKQKLQNQTASSSLPEQMAEQDNSNTSSFSSSRTEMQDEDHNNRLSENVKQYLEEVPKLSISSIGLPPQIPQKASPAVKESLSHPHSEVSFKGPEVLSILPADKSVEVNASPEVEDEVVHASNEKENLKLFEQIDSGSEISTNKEDIMQLSQPAESNTSESSNVIEQNRDKSAEQQSVIEPKADPPELNEQGEAGSSSMKTEVQAEQNTTEAGVSGVNQSFDNPIMSPTPPQILEVDQISTVSSSCSSPRSVLPGKNRRISSASFDQQMPIQNDESQSIEDDIARNNSLNDLSAESVNLVSPPRNSQHLVADPMDLPSSSSDVGISEEPSAGIIECTSKPVISLQATTRLPECIDGSPSKTEENAFESNAPRSMLKEEETSNSPVQSTREADLTSSKNHSAEDENEDKGKPVVCIEGESKNVVENKAAIEPSVPAAAETAVEKEPCDPLSRRPEVEAAVVHNGNETVDYDTRNEKSLIHQENFSDQLKTIEDYKHEPDDTKVVVEPSTSIKPEVKEAPKNETNTAE